MKSLMTRLDIFCLKHPNFGVRRLIYYVLVGYVVCYVMQLADTQNMFIAALVFDAQKIFEQGQVWRLITFVFVPQNLGLSNILWFAVELSFYYFIGIALEDTWGKGKFTVYYLFGVLLTALFGAICWFIIKLSVPLSAFFINLSLFFAFATFYPDTIFRVFFIIPLKAKWLAWAETLIFIYFILTWPFPMNLLPVMAIANYLLFCGGWLFARMRPKNIKAKRAQAQNVIKYKTAAREYNRQQSRKNYDRKCEVCGKTDAQFPDLEFRFCSKCEGYHCYCIEHINAHTHVKGD